MTASLGRNPRTPTRELVLAPKQALGLEAVTELSTEYYTNNICFSKEKIEKLVIEIKDRKIGEVSQVLLCGQAIIYAKPQKIKN